jgi:hypothetical protein
MQHYAYPPSIMPEYCRLRVLLSLQTYRECIGQSRSRRHEQRRRDGDGDTDAFRRLLGPDAKIENLYMEFVLLHLFSKGFREGTRARVAPSFTAHVRRLVCQRGR